MKAIGLSNFLIDDLKNILENYEIKPIKLLAENVHRGEGFAKLFKVEDRCTKCGICVKVCSMNNVFLE